MSKHKSRTAVTTAETSEALKTPLIPAESSFSWNRWGLCAFFLIVVTVAAYSNAYDGIAIFDDDPFIKNSAEIIKPEMPSLFRPAIDRPFIRWTLWCNYQISGFQLWSYHWVNLFAHVMAVLTLFEIVRRLTKIKLSGLVERQPVWGWLLPLSVASVWGVHPLNTQAVTYVIQRCESMMGMFFLMTLLCLIHAVQHGGRHQLWLVAGLVCAWLGMGCKQVMVTVTGVAILLDYVFLEPSVGKILARRWWFYAGLTLVGFYGFYDALVPVLNRPVSVAVSSVASSSSASEMIKDPTVSAGFHFEGFTKWEYFRTQLEIIPYYVKLAVWPDPLCLDYRWLVQSNPAIYVTWGVILACVFACGVYLSWLRASAGFLILSFFFILAPTSSIMPINDMALEHRMYLPLISVVALICLGLSKLFRESLPDFGVTGYGCVMLAWTIGLGYLTYQRNLDYRDEISLWQSVVEAAPNNDRAWRNLGHYYNVFKQPDKSLVAFERGLDLLKRIIPLPPDQEFAEVYRNVGNAQKDLGNYDLARATLETSLKYNDRDAITHESLGRLYAISGKMDIAGTHFYKAQELNPRDGDIQHDLGAYNMAFGKFDEALKHFEKACQLEPLRMDFGQTLAGTYANLERYEEAVRAYDALLARLPPATYERPQIEAYRAKAYQALLQQRAQKQTQPR